MKFVKLATLTLILIIIGAVSLLFFVQSDWAKEKLTIVLQQAAREQGVHLKIGKIEGSLPLKWTLSRVDIQMTESESLTIDKLRLRLAFLPLLRGHATISYLHGNAVVYRFSPRPYTNLLHDQIPLPPINLRQLKIEQLTLINQATGESGVYTIEGRGFLNRRKNRFALAAHIHSETLDCKAVLQGNKRRDEIAGNIDVVATSPGSFAPLTTLPYPFQLQTTFVGPWITKKTVMGDLSLEIDHPEKISLETHFHLHPDQALDLSSLTLTTDLGHLAGSAQLSPDHTPTKLDLTFSLDQLSKLAPAISGKLRGAIFLDHDDCRMTAESDQIDIWQIPLSHVRIDLASKEWVGACHFSANHPIFSTQGRADFDVRSFESLQLTNLLVTAASLTLAGDVSIDLNDFSHLQGGVTCSVADLKQFQPFFPWKVGGQMGVTTTLHDDQIEWSSVLKNLHAGPVVATEVRLRGVTIPPFEGSVDVELYNTAVDDLLISSLRFSLSDWNYSLQAAGEWKEPFDVTSQGQLHYQPHAFDLTMNSFIGQLLDKNVALQQPFTFSYKPEQWQLDNLQLSLDDGTVASSFSLTPTHGTLSLHATHFPLDFLTLITSRFSLQGVSSIDLEIDASEENLIGHCNVLLEQAELYPTGAKTPIQTKGTVQAHLQNHTLQLHTHLVATGEQFFDLSATLPFRFHLNPLQFLIESDKNATAQLTMEGHAEQLFDFVNLGTQRVGGFISSRLLLSGTWSRPSLFGTTSIQGGFYQNYFIGMNIKEMNGTAVAEGNRIVARDVEATDGNEGVSRSNALFHLNPTLPFVIEGEINNFRVIQFEWLTTACSGPFKISGNLEKAVAEGSLTIDKAEIRIPENLPADLPVLPVTFINQPQTFYHPHELHREPFPFYYNLHISGSEKIHISGRGLEADLAGDLHITGKNLTVSATGALHTKKGQFSFAGKEFTITQGEVTFSESQTFLNIATSLDLPDLSVTLVFRGTLTAPELVLQSNPPLPTGALLARILFNKDVSELTASQALQLADTVLTLSGGAGPNVMETIRNNLGIDRLSISASEETGRVYVQVGKKIAKGVMITLTQSTESSQVLVEVELNGGFVLSAETQEDDQGKFSFKWHKNY